MTKAQMYAMARAIEGLDDDAARAKAGYQGRTPGDAVQLADDVALLLRAPPGANCDAEHYEEQAAKAMRKVKRMRELARAATLLSTHLVLCAPLLAACFYTR